MLLFAPQVFLFKCIEGERAIGKVKVYEYIIGLGHYAPQEEVEGSVVGVGFEYEPGVFIEVAGVYIYSNGCAPPDLVNEYLKHERCIVVGIF